jgi:predicted dehydrogenase
MARKKYVLVGTGGRARMFYQALAKDFRETAELVAFCDINQTRMDFANKVLRDELDHPAVKTYKCDRFDEMIATEKPATVIVTTMDRLHHKYVVRAMELGCDAITEKPMTVDAPKCQAILDTIKKTGKNLRVTFNYRYAPSSTKIRELLMNDTIGRPLSIAFEWLLNTSHGADYFRRWHRDKRNSGGLMVHKATHHFDLVNFWLASQPQTVFAMGDLVFYGRENAENRGVTKFYSRVHGSENAKDDPFALKMEGNKQHEALYLDAEHEDGYFRDQSVFGDGISIEDTMNVVVRYKSGVIMSYCLNAFLPWEGYNLAINGTQGRLEAKIAHATYVNAAGDVGDEGAQTHEKIMVFPLWEKPYDVEIPTAEGGHGGGDPIMLNDIFGTPEPDPFNRAATHVDGAMSILTGVAANESFKTGQPVKIDDLVTF